MKFKSRIRLVLLFLLSVVFSIPDKHPLDETKIKKMILDNGLKVILVSNPKYNISAASMNVKVGSLSDPDDAQGLAHFLEHMLFLGTEKYPDVEDYKLYLSNNGGYSNAYTAEDHTNYLFEVIHDAYEGALDRFSQFFIAPAFNKDFTIREINAVNSEFQKNLENDYWRMRQIKRTIYDLGHPSNHFEIGSSETLENVDRQVLLDFHKTFYSSNQMTLALLSKYSISEMEDWAIKYFSPIKNNNKSDIEYPPIYLSEMDAIRLIKIKPIKDNKELILEFPLPFDLYQYYDSKPMRVLGSLLGHEGKGSLLSLLKLEGLATGLNGGGSSDTPDYGSAGIRIQLTDKGVLEYQNVLGHFFSYIQMLSKEGYKEYLFYEQQTLAKLEEVYSDKGEGTWSAVSYANNLAFYPYEIAERVDYHYGQPNSQAYMKVLSYIRPNNMLCILVDKNQETPLEEYWYKSKYDYQIIKGEDFVKLQTPKALPSLHMPNKNNYLPEKANLIPIVDNKSNIPTLLIDSKGLKIYHGRDIDFQRPKASYLYKIFFPKEFSELDNQVLMKLYMLAVNESMNESSYPARLAGMDYSVSSDEEGITIIINGYSDSIDNLLVEILSNMKKISITTDQFTSIRDKKVRDWKNFSKGNAYQIARQHMRKIVRKYYYTNDEYIESAKKISLNQVNKFAKKLLKKGFVQGMIYGNVNIEQAQKNTELLIETLKMKPIAWDKVAHQQNLVFNPGEEIVKVVHSEVNNSCFSRLQYFGNNTIKDDAYAKVLGTFVESPFFLEMRTNQQLGYIVWGGAGSSKKSSYFIFIIQSGDYSADYLQQQADNYIDTFPDSLRIMNNEDFQIIKNSVIEKIKEKPTSIAEQANKYYTMAFDFNGNFDRDQQLITAVNDLSKEESINLLDKIISENTMKKSTILLYAKQHDVGENIKSTFNNINQWKSSRKYD